MSCSGKHYELAQKFLGTWKEYTITPDGESLVGTLKVEWELDNCIVVQHFQAAEGDFRFMAFGYLDSEHQAWQETYIFNDGRTAHYRWREENDAVIVERVGGNPNNKRRLVIRNIRYEAYDVAEEKSVDNGQTWEFVEATITRREK